MKQKLLINIYRDECWNERERMSLPNVILMLSQKIFLSADGFFLHGPSSQYLIYSKSSQLSNQIHCYLIICDVIFAYLLSLYCWDIFGSLSFTPWNKKYNLRYGDFYLNIHIWISILHLFLIQTCHLRSDKQNVSRGRCFSTSTDMVRICFLAKSFPSPLDA